MSAYSAESHGSALLCDLANSDRRRSASGDAAVCLPTRKMEPTEVNANRLARLPGGRMSLDEAG
jgi:hypothetical protein